MGTHPTLEKTRIPWGALARLLGVFRPEQGWRDGFRHVLAFVLLFAVGMVLISLIGDQGLWAYFRLRGEARQLHEDVAALRERRAVLTRTIQALRHDPQYIELLARRRLGLVRPGELIVQLPLPDPGKNLLPSDRWSQTESYP